MVSNSRYTQREEQKPGRARFYGTFVICFMNFMNSTNLPFFRLALCVLPTHTHQVANAIVPVVAITWPSKLMAKPL